MTQTKVASQAGRQIVAGNAASINRLAGKKVAPSTPAPPQGV